MKKPIRVWRYDDAPVRYKYMSQHGGDEDWLAFVPDGYEVPMWMDEGTRFGCCRVTETKVKGGTVVIGAHA